MLALTLKHRRLTFCVGLFQHLGIAALLIVVVGCGPLRSSKDAPDTRLAEAGKSAEEFALELDKPLDERASRLLKPVEDLCTKRLSETPGNVAPYVLLGQMYIQCFRFSDALRSFGKAVDLAPEIREPNLGLGTVYYKIAVLKMFRESRSPITPQVSLSPRVQEVFALAQFYLSRGTTRESGVVREPGAPEVTWFRGEEIDRMLEACRGYIGTAETTAQAKPPQSQDQNAHQRQANAGAVEWTKDLLSDLAGDPFFVKSLAIYEELNSKERAQGEAVSQRVDEATRKQKQLESQIDLHIATNPALKGTWEQLKNEERNLDQQMRDLVQNKRQLDDATERLEVTRSLRNATDLLEKGQPLNALPSAHYALIWFRAHGYADRESLAVGSVAGIYRRLHRYDLAILYDRRNYRLIAAGKHAGNQPLEKVMCLSSLGDDYLGAGMISNAIACYQEGISVAESHGIAEWPLQLRKAIQEAKERPSK